MTGGAARPRSRPTRTAGTRRERPVLVIVVGVIADWAAASAATAVPASAATTMPDTVIFAPAR